MKLLKRIASWVDVERELYNRFGNSIEQTFAVAGQTYTLTHGLAREPKGWRVTDRDMPAEFGRTAWDTNTITLYSNVGGVTATFEVY